jgi:hypothetical protein
VGHATTTSSVRTSLVARSDTLSPDAITALLGLEPTRIRRRTDPAARQPARDHWELELGTSEGDRLSAHLIELASRVTNADPRAVRLIVFTTLSSNGDSAGFKATPAALGRVADLPATLVLDLQPPPDPDAPNDDLRLIDVGLTVTGPQVSVAVGHEPTQRFMDALQEAQTVARVRSPARADAFVDHIEWLHRAERDAFWPVDAVLDVRYAATSGQGSIELQSHELRELADRQLGLSITLHRFSTP